MSNITIVSICIAISIVGFFIFGAAYGVFELMRERKEEEILKWLRNNHIGEGCNGCMYADKSEKQEPCVNCCRIYRDQWKDAEKSRRVKCND